MKTDTSTKSGYAYMLVKERILDGTYLPGQRIVIDQIAKEVGSSHIPVREAIRKLEADQYIEYRAHAGAIVTGIDAEAYEETLQLLSILEGFATAEASSFIGEKELGTLHTLNDKMQTALECYDLTTFGKLNKSFHFAIYDHCPNELLVAHITSAWEKLDTVRTSAFTTLPMRAPNSLKEHRELLHMFQEEAPKAEIEAFSRQHKQNTLLAFQSKEEPE